MNPTYFLIDELPEVDNVPYRPLIFDNRGQGNISIPKPRFNSITVSLNGRADALLNWKEARLQALQAVAQGLKVFWKIDLGLFSNLYAPLSDKTQYLTLNLSLEHFCNSLWDEFRQHTLGLSLYEGTLDFNQTFKWNDYQEEMLRLWLAKHFGDVIAFNKVFETDYQTFNEITSSLLEAKGETQQIVSLFCRDTSVEYLNMLAHKLPDGLFSAVLLDVSTLKEPLLMAKLLSKDKFEGVARFISEGIFSQDQSRGGIGIEMNPKVAILETAPTLGICLPAIQRVSALEKQLKSMIERLMEKQFLFRFIEESRITSEWDGLDYIVVIAETMSSQGIRKLRGFCAAGGTVITIGECLDLPQEVAVEDWLLGQR